MRVGGELEEGGRGVGRGREGRWVWFLFFFCVFSLCFWVWFCVVFGGLGSGQLVGKEWAGRQWADGT